jgi:hypothetical protein
VSPVCGIFTSNVDNIQSQGTLPPIADHEGIFVNFHRIQVKDSLIRKSIFDFKHIDEIGLRNFIKNYDFESHVFSKPVLQQAEAMTSILDAAQRKFVPIKTITINPRDQPWVNSYTRLLMRKKNRNYRIFKKINSQLCSVMNKHGVSEELVTRLTDKKKCASKRARSSSNESTKANLRAKNAFFNTVNATMSNYEISAKKKVFNTDQTYEKPKNVKYTPFNPRQYCY